MKQFYLIDTTLRDGEQTPGIAFSVADKMAIAEKLNELGVDEVEAGTPAIGKQEQEAIRAISRAGFAFKTSCWCRANGNDIIQANKLQTESVNISLPVSDIQIKALQKSKLWVMQELQKMVKLAKSCFAHVTLGAQDASRAEEGFLDEYIAAAIQSGADRIRIADTVGILMPFEVNQLFQRLSSRFSDFSFEFHGHNDLGMATANGLAAFQSGASCVSATVNGIGERAGNTRLEEMVGILHARYGVETYRTHVLADISALVSRLSGKNLDVNKPFVGTETFTHESGIHTAAMLKNPRTYQVLQPEDYGAQPMNFSFGKHSGGAGLSHLFHRVNISLSDHEKDALLQKIKREAGNKGRSLTDFEIMQLYQTITKKIQSKKLRKTG